MQTQRVASPSGVRRFYLAAAVAGTVVPWLFFGSFLADDGVDLVAFVEALFANGAAGGFTADLLITATVFWVWSYLDSRRVGVTRWWLVVPATLFVGLSLAFPLYLYWRAGVRSTDGAERTASASDRAASRT
ncbi:MAG: DUF2834 domain-containing protein [Actinomycetota bacterium]